MSNIEQRRSVACPLAQAGMRLKQFFSLHGNREGDIAKLTIGIDLEVPGLAVPLALTRAVVVTIQPHHLPADMEPRYRVQWAPERPGPFPLFSGELIVESADDYNSFILCIAGNYTPPLGVVGQGFDAVVGNRVAQSTVEGLLQRIGGSIELEFAADEAKKHVALPIADDRV
jgi:hypothetical protein